MINLLEDILNEIIPDPINLMLGGAVCFAVIQTLNTAKMIPQMANNGQSANVANVARSANTPNNPNNPNDSVKKDMGSSGNSFIDSIAQSAVDSGKKHGIPPSVIIAQAALESGWGKSGLTVNSNNLFGIKGTGTAGSTNLPTGEVFGGRSVTIRSNFRAYNNLGESIDDHGKFFNENPRYQGALDAYKLNRNADEFAQKIAEAGYATDPDYASKITKLINRYNLKQYD